MNATGFAVGMACGVAMGNIAIGAALGFTTVSGKAHHL